MLVIQNINLVSLLDTLVSLTTAFVLGGLIGFERGTDTAVNLRVLGTTHLRPDKTILRY